MQSEHRSSEKRRQSDAQALFRIVGDESNQRPAEEHSTSHMTRHEGMVTFVTKILGDKANWYRYEIINHDGLTIGISHSSGEKWTRFLEGFIEQCFQFSGVNVDVHRQGGRLSLSFPDHRDAPSD